jgi:hypothetical protein
MGSPFELPVALPSRDKKGHGLRSMAFFISRLLKNGHQSRVSRDFPHPRPVRWQINFVEKSVKTSPFKWLQDQSGFYLTWQVVAANIGRERFKTVPYKGFGEPPRSGISQSSTCICPPAEASAQAGPFLSNLGKMTFSAAYWGIGNAFKTTR